nr:uncharacterized protein LOC128696567 isoform X2 [Cherax quadricarinatus]
MPRPASSISTLVTAQLPKSPQVVEGETSASYLNGVGRRRWPLLSNAGMSQQELQEAGEERRARRERFRDRQMERDTRRLP